MESKKHLIQFDADLKSIHSNLDELTSQLSAIQDKYTGDNGVQAASLELHYFEKTLQVNDLNCIPMLEGDHKINLFFPYRSEFLEEYSQKKIVPILYL